MGVRNHVLVVPTVICSAVVTERIAATVPGAVALPHLAGCGQLGPDMQLTHDTLAAYCQHPNVGAVLVVALGCEQVVGQMLAESARAAGKRSAIVSIQGEGGTPKAIAKGTEMAAGLARDLQRDAREWCGIDNLILSLKCGGSDYTSGLSANPALGRVADRLNAFGGATVLGEIAEIMGAEHLLAAARHRTRRGEAAAARDSARRERSPGPRPRYSRHAAVAGKHSRRADDHRREVAWRHAQGRRGESP